MLSYGQLCLKLPNPKSFSYLFQYKQIFIDLIGELVWKTVESNLNMLFKAKHVGKLAKTFFFPISGPYFLSYSWVTANQHFKSSVIHATKYKLESLDFNTPKYLWWQKVLLVVRTPFQEVLQVFCSIHVVFCSGVDSSCHETPSSMIFLGKSSLFPFFKSFLWESTFFVWFWPWKETPRQVLLKGNCFIIIGTFWKQTFSNLKKIVKKILF